MWPVDRISDDHTVEDRIHNAVLAERERCTGIVRNAVADAVAEDRERWAKIFMDGTADKTRV